MAFRFSLILHFLLLTFIVFIQAQNVDERDPTIKTMEEHSGYPLHEILSISSFSVDSLNLQKQIDELSSFSDSPAPSVTRILYSENDVLARRFIKNLMAHAGLSVREDAVGNIFGRWKGSEPDLSVVSTGSHIDAIPYSGKYDGVIGVLGAIEAINVLKRYGFKPKRSLEVIMFTSEEPTRYGISCLGSRLLAGSVSLAGALKQTVDNHNISFLDAAKSAGYAKNEDFSNVFLDDRIYSAFVELHIEQGPILENEGCMLFYSFTLPFFTLHIYKCQFTLSLEGVSIGIVTAIAAPASIKVEFGGSGGHAGAVLMPQRNDAGLAAAELALAVEKHVLESRSIDTVGTVGILELHPGAINSIPSKSHVEIDTRDIDEKRRNNVIEKIHESAVEISKRRGVEVLEFKIVNQDPPACSDDSIIKAMESATQVLNLSYKKMISRAYHDSLFMARKAPMGMIFIPCYKGYSHKPEEYAAPEDIANGVKVLALTLANLSNVNVSSQAAFSS
ncbi:ureidoglycolate hydrolase isoform X1 [Cynara cardunculus var. scolymus]|uniref:ureidoglycolate hydrolase isoform X1 n=1 Tax=Cynara cardunculus var. scolymus TaxID=59895 RepID=UPI000D62B0B6|nr:ureidoglycolate hydrolase isoform X1 [Cynara cardunculus var. scolymus]